ncbi:MAG: DEAD/DEAH box helicase family protein [Syntrophorhabdaceae bacterium]|nr:DEAD/DEAH box helicase family protein [Syntrophorhabdaceae bacterium]
MKRNVLRRIEYEEETEGQQENYFHPVTGEPLYVQRTFTYKSLPTIRKFHACPESIRAIVGPVGSGKTAAATIEVGYRIPMMLWNRYGINKTRGIILRNTYPMLIDSTQKTFFEWFPPSIYGTYNKNEKIYVMQYTTMDAKQEPVTLEIEVLFRSCDSPEDVEKFRGYELTWYLIDEADEVHIDIKNMLKQRIGRCPSMKVWYSRLKKRFHHLQGLTNLEIQHYLEEEPERYQMKFGVEISNPPSTESNLYWVFNWQTPVPGPKPERKPLKGHAGFWQPERENEENLIPGYYDRMAEAYAYAPDWVARYIKGQPGVRLKGKLVYNNFSRKVHEAVNKLVWNGEILYRGWDNTGLHPGAIIVQSPTARQVQVMREFWGERENVASFAKRVIAECNKLYPNAEWIEYADPAGWAQFSKKGGGLTSNSEMMMEECPGLVLEKSEQNFKARVNAVDEQMMEMVAGGEPAFMVDPDCVGIINGFLGGYFYPRITSSAAGEEIYSENPVKNKYADLHDALQYVLVKIRGASPKGGGKANKLGRPNDPLLIC